MQFSPRVSLLWQVLRHRLIKTIFNVPVCTSFEFLIMYVIYHERCSPPYHTIPWHPWTTDTWVISCLKPLTRELISWPYHIQLGLKSTTMVYRIPLGSTSKSTNQIKSILIKILKKNHFVLYIFGVNVVGWSRSNCICFASRDFMVY